MAWQNPKTDWVVNPKNPMAEDFNRIEGNIQALKDDIEIKKGDIVNALQSIGMDVNITDTYEDIANKIRAADQGAKIITPGTSNKTIPKGFHSGQGYVKGDSNLRSSNIKRGVSIFGISGSYVGGQLVEASGSVTGTAPEVSFPFEPIGCYAYYQIDSDYYSSTWVYVNGKSYNYEYRYYSSQGTVITRVNSRTLRFQAKNSIERTFRYWVVGISSP